MGTACSISRLGQIHSGDFAWLLNNKGPSEIAPLRNSLLAVARREGSLLGFRFVQDEA